MSPEDAALLTRAEARALDASLIESGVLGVLLMENAGRGAAEVIAAQVRARGLRGACVLVGVGNNGGDGFVVARHLALMCPGLSLTLACIVDPTRIAGAAAVMRDAWRAHGGAIAKLDDGVELARVFDGCDLIVDALFGTGLSRPLDGLAARCVDAANGRSWGLAVALDVPSGLDADTGAALGPSVFHADLTCTFGASKPGLHTGDGRSLAGEVVTVGLGAPLPAGALAAARSVLSAFRAPRERSLAAHKGAAGRVLLVAGSAGKVGAALLAARGAHRGGAGLVTLASRAAAQLDGRVLETMTLGLGEDPYTVAPMLLASVQAADALVVGPGMGLDEHAIACLDSVLRHARGPVVIDADAITLLARHTGDRVGTSPRVLTPHPLELARLLRFEGADRVQGDRLECAREAARRYEAIVVLKGAGTVVARPDGAVAIMPYAEPTLAVAGSGDVLSGVIAARLAEGARGGDSVWEAVLCAVHAHGRAGERLRRRMGGARGALASEIADEIPMALVASSGV